MTTTPERRPSRAPLRFDWQRLSSPTDDGRFAMYYRAQPDHTYYLHAFKSGGSWRWSIVIISTFPPIESKSAPTLAQAKHDAEAWYRDHGGRPAQMTWIGEPLTRDKYSMLDERPKDDERNGDPAPF